MNRTSPSIRLLSAGAAVTVAFALLHGVASMARPTAMEQLAQAKKESVTVASARERTLRPR